MSDYIRYDLKLWCQLCY